MALGPRTQTSHCWKISFHHLKQVVKVAEIGIYPCSLDLLFPFAPLGLEGFAYVVPCRQKGVYSWCGAFEFRQCLSGFDSTSFLGNLLVNDHNSIRNIGDSSRNPRRGVFLIYWNNLVTWWPKLQDPQGWMAIGWTDEFLDVDVPRVIWNHPILARPCWLFSWQRCIPMMDIIRTNQRSHELPCSLYFGVSQVYPESSKIRRPYSVKKPDTKCLSHLLSTIE